MTILPYRVSNLAKQTRLSVKLNIEGQKRDLGAGFTDRRLLPTALCRMVGPFISLDHMGPVEFQPGNGLDVRSRLYINLATVTYLFQGEILHRDSLGSGQLILKFKKL